MCVRNIVTTLGTEATQTIAVRDKVTVDTVLSEDMACLPKSSLHNVVAVQHSHNIWQRYLTCYSQKRPGASRLS